MGANLSLYALTGEYLAAADKLAELDLDEQTVADTLEGLQGTLEVKATNVAMFVRNLDASAEAIRQAEADMAARRKAIQARAERVRRYLLENMERAGITKIECPHFALSVRKNPPSVAIVSEADIPPEFLRTPPPPAPTPDKKAIADAIKAGRDVPGATLQTTNRLEIK